jgi:hypothetical protein
MISFRLQQAFPVRCFHSQGLEGEDKERFKTELHSSQDLVIGRPFVLFQCVWCKKSWLCSYVLCPAGLQSIISAAHQCAWAPHTNMNMLSKELAKLPYHSQHVEMTFARAYGAAGTSWCSIPAAHCPIRHIAQRGAGMHNHVYRTSERRRFLFEISIPYSYQHNPA